MHLHPYSNFIIDQSCASVALYNSTLAFVQYDQALSFEAFDFGKALFNPLVSTLA